MINKNRHNLKPGDIVTLDYYNNPSNIKHITSKIDIVTLLLLERIHRATDTPVMWRVYYISGSDYYQNHICDKSRLALVFDYSLDPTKEDRQC